ncbi:MAG: SMR family transporter [Pseudomonadota bacterium]
MAWALLMIAGALEVAWSAGLKKLGEGFSPALLAVTAVALIASMVTLYGAMTRLPLGIAYPIWTGIGSVGSVLVGVVFFGQTISATGVAGVVLLILGMALLGADAH